MTNQIDYFRKELLLWHRDNKRELPWKKNKDPYSIWLSEIIMQQTRVEQGTPYYLRFIEAFPNIKDLAEADIDTIMRLWEGLGYYSRARNLHFTAKYIHFELNGVFPRDYKDILNLKGIGPYTAAAISSFAYDQVYPVVDGNVIRLLSRYFGITDFVDDTKVKKQINELANECISLTEPARYNQAIMDYGSAVCSPKLVKCDKCDLKKHCQAYNYDLVSMIPAKEKKIKIRMRYFHFFIIYDGINLILEKRIAKDVWRELYQFPILETKDMLDIPNKNIKKMVEKMDIKEFRINFKHNKWYKQTLTHQKINATFHYIKVNKKLKEKTKPYYLVDIKNLRNFAFPKIINTFISENLKL